MAQAARINIQTIAEIPWNGSDNIREKFFPDYCRLSGDLTQSIGSKNFIDCLSDMFRKLLDLDDVFICLLKNNQLPEEILLSNTEENGSQIQPGEGFYLGNYPSANLANHLAKFPGIHETTQPVSQFHSFKRIEKNNFLRNGARYLDMSDISMDSCTLLFQLEDPPDSIISISLSKPSTSPGFLIEELNCLSEITPLLSNLIGQHFSRVSTPTSKSILRHELEASFESFGQRILTKREHQIVKMILNGYSNKGISEELNISFETVKLHRKNAYTKLDINSMGEMFNLFLISILNPPVEFAGKN